MVRALVAGGRRGLTVAPECGSDALRYSLGKPFSNDTIIETLSMAADEGVRSVKLYFMVGLPGERDEDVAQIADLARSIRDSARLKVVLAVNLLCLSRIRRGLGPLFWDKEKANGALRSSKSPARRQQRHRSQGGRSKRGSCRISADLGYASRWRLPGNKGEVLQLLPKCERNDDGIVLARPILKALKRLNENHDVF